MNTKYINNILDATNGYYTRIINNLHVSRPPSGDTNRQIHKSLIILAPYNDSNKRTHAHTSQHITSNPSQAKPKANQLKPTKMVIHKMAKRQNGLLRIGYISFLFSSRFTFELKLNK